MAVPIRAILDYNMIQPDLELVSLTRSKRFGADILFTCLLNPWTALYAGYTDPHEGWRCDPHLPPYLTYRSGFPQYSTGRQFFVK